MISLFGHGKTTKAIAKRLVNCSIFDDGFKEKSIDEYGNLLLPTSEFDAHKSTLEIPSPGFPPSHVMVKKARNLISEYDYFFDDMPSSIWITGTNGKTTTTQMLQHLLTQKGSVCGGNIGEPLANLDTKAPLWILETSSFTLHYTKKARPNIYVILPIKPDHISWHGSFETYEEAKLSPMKRMREGSVVILPKKYADYETLAYKVTYDDEFDLAKTMGIEIERVSFKPPFLQDAILAMSVQKILYDIIDYALINSFKTDVHKLEEFRDKEGRLWVNDTKGTNVDATIEALKRYKDKQMLIILGGDDKGAPLDALFEAMKPLHVEVFAIGSNTDKIVNHTKEIGKTVHACYELRVAVELMKKNHTLQTVAILSPAAASLDQFSSYAHRGDMFKNLVLS